MHIRGADSRSEQTEELTSLKIGPLRMFTLRNRKKKKTEENEWNLRDL